jgi:putative Mn2+ efflux pump MntP
MSLIDIILLAVALAMDCLTVSIVSGVITNGQWIMDNWLRAAIIFNCHN